MENHKQHTTKQQMPSTVATRFTWREHDGTQRAGAITGYYDYRGTNMPRGQYIQADGKRWVYEAQITGWCS